MNNPNAAITALSVSCLPINSFIFFGYPPEKQSTRLFHFKRLYQCINTLVHKPTVIYYCSPHNLQAVLLNLKNIFGNSTIVICRELTKIHEEYWRGTIAETMKKFIEPKREFVLLAY